MGTIHTYSLNGTWTGDRRSVGRMEGTGVSTSFSVPGNLSGPGVGTSAEEMLLAAASACYLITLATLFSNRTIPYVRIDLDSEGFVEDDHGLRFDRIEHRPTIVVEEQVDEDVLLALAGHAEHACMISSALRGNVAVSVHPQILIQSKSY